MNNNPYDQQPPVHQSPPEQQQSPAAPYPRPNTPDTSFDEKKYKRKALTQFILNILYGSLIVSALIGIAAIVFGNDEYGSKAVGTIFLLIAVDLILLLALLPKNPYFRYAIWGLSILAFTFTTLGIWLPKNQAVYSDTYPFEMVAPYQRTFGVIAEGIGAGFWLLLLTVILLSFVSLAEPLIQKTGKRAIGFYWALIIIAIVGTLPLAISTPFTIQTPNDPDFALKIYASAFILSLTIVLILAIAIIARTIFDARDKTKNIQPSGNMNQQFSNNGQQQGHHSAIPAQGDWRDNRQPLSHPQQPNFQQPSGENSAQSVPQGFQQSAYPQSPYSAPQQSRQAPLNQNPQNNPDGVNGNEDPRTQQ